MSFFRRHKIKRGLEEELRYRQGGEYHRITQPGERRVSELISARPIPRQPKPMPAPTPMPYPYLPDTDVKDMVIDGRGCPDCLMNIGGNTGYFRPKRPKTGPITDKVVTPTSQKTTTQTPTVVAPQMPKAQPKKINKILLIGGMALAAWFLIPSKKKGKQTASKKVTI